MSEPVSLASGTPHLETCPRCWEMALVVAEIFALTSEAVGDVARFSACQACGWTPYAERSESSR